MVDVTVTVVDDRVLDVWFAVVEMLIPVVVVDVLEDEVVVDDFGVVVGVEVLVEVVVLVTVVVEVVSLQSKKLPYT